MNKGCRCYRCLVATHHFKRMNPTKVYEGRVSDSRLVAVIHVERVNPTQVYEGRVSDSRLVATTHV